MITSNLYDFQLLYDSPNNGDERFDGRISGYMSNNKNFDYYYDQLGRLRKGSLTDGTMSEELTCDKGGDIKTLKRDGSLINYNYDGNMLTSVSGGGLSSASYEYDKNGNATKDGSRNIGITYNLLDQPERISGA